jgi:hypothetical protein
MGFAHFLDELGNTLLCRPMARVHEFSFLHFFDDMGILLVRVIDMLMKIGPLKKSSGLFATSLTSKKLSDIRPGSMQRHHQRRGTCLRCSPGRHSCRNRNDLPQVMVKELATKASLTTRRERW